MKMMMMDIEDRIFELTGEMAIGSDVVDAIVNESGVDRDTAWDLYIKVRRERGSPNLVALREVIDRLGRLSFI